MEYLILLYFTANAFMTGFAHGASGKVWYFVLLGIFFAIPVVIGVYTWGTIKESLKKQEWFNDLEFWIELNITGYWSDLENPEKYERHVLRRNHPRVVSQWYRIKKKYNY